MADVASLGIEVDSGQAATASKNLDALSKSADAATKGVDALNKASAGARSGTEVFSRQLDAIQRQMIALAGNLGIVGTLLAGMGPGGLAAAAGIGALVAVFNALSERANALGQQASGLSKFATTTGFTVEQLQAVSIESAKFGISGEEAGVRINRFAQQVKELNEANGPLYEIILKNNKGIAQQMTTTTDVVKMLDLYTKATINATRADQARADTTAFGRGGIVFGAAARSMSDQGGIAKMAQDMDRFGVLSSNDVDILNNLKNAIDELGKKNKTAMDLWFSQDVLMREAQAALKAKEILETLQQVSQLGPGNLLTAINTMGQSTTEEAIGSALDAQIAKAKTLLALQLRLGQTANFSGSLTHLPNTAEQNIANITAELNAQNRLVTALGAGATVRDQYNQQLLAMRKAQADNILTTEQFIKARGILNLTFSSQNIQATTAALGQLATVTQTVNAAMSQISLQQAKGQTSLSSDQINMIKQMQQTTAEGAQLQVRTANIVVSADELMQQKKRELAITVFNGTMTQQQADQALLNYASHARDAAVATEVYASKFPQLTQAMRDFGDSNKLLDATMVSSLNQIGTSLTDMTTGTKSASEAFSDMGKFITRAIEEMIIKMTILQPIAQLLQSTLKGAGGGFNLLGLLGIGGTSSYSGAGASASAVNPSMFHSGGIVGLEGSPFDSVASTYFNNAPRFHSGGMVGNETGIIAQKGEGVFTPGQMAAIGAGMSSGDVNVIINNAPAGGADVKKSRNQDGGVNLEITFGRMIDDRMNAAAADRGSSFNRTLRRTIGSNPASTIG